MNPEIRDNGEPKFITIKEYKMTMRRAFIIRATLVFIYLTVLLTGVLLVVAGIVQR